MSTGEVTSMGKDCPVYEAGYHDQNKSPIDFILALKSLMDECYEVIETLEDADYPHSAGALHTKLLAVDRPYI